MDVPGVAPSSPVRANGPRAQAIRFMKLKQYQTDTLSLLRRFLEEARIAGPKNAYEAITKEPEQAGRLGRYGGPYRPLAGLPNVPYVCLRLPTGGGKTILGAYAIRIARDAWIEKDYPLVLWLVPTNTIRRQTAEALKNSRHPYRRALDEAFAGRVRVFDIADFTHIRPNDVRERCCVVVGTIQTLRVTNTEGRKAYAHHEEMEPHFSALPQTAPGLERLETGGVKFSFANLLHIRRPLMIVDEAHNAVTGLTRQMQARVNPCAIVEFTATPRLRSNILYSVTAQELKAAEMVKLPIMLSEHDAWENAVNGAIAARASLEKTAKDDADYIRPIVLFQAQPRNQEVRVAALKKYLVEDRADPGKQDRRRHRRPAGIGRHRLVRPGLSYRMRHHGRGAEGGMGLFLRLRFLFRIAHPERGRRGAASGTSASDALRQEAPGCRSEQGLCLRVRAVIRRGRAGTGRQAGRHGL